MSCWEGYFRLLGNYGYGAGFSAGLGFGSQHLGYRSQSCCPNGVGIVGPYWGRRPGSGSAGGLYGCNNPYSCNTIVTNLGCEKYGIGPRGTGILYGQYSAPCGAIFL